jgi:hypothetical protein
VRLKEIAATLNRQNTQGCSFAPEMAQFCGTTQKVLKPVERFVDERDMRIKKKKALYFEGSFAMVHQPGAAMTELLLFLAEVAQKMLSRIFQMQN